MQKTVFRIQHKDITFLFKQKPYYQDECTIVMGFPYNMNCKNFSIQDIDNVKGYYTFIKFYQDKVRIINDMFGNYRVYYLNLDNEIYFSDDFLTLFNLLDKKERVPNKFEIEYWDKHRYTTGGNTFVKKIKKIKPAHIMEITVNGIQEELYFKNIENKPNRKKHFDSVLTDLRDTVSIIKQMPQKKVLLFSGGADSTLIVKMLQEQEVEFIPVFAKVTPTNAMNYEDIVKIKYSAEKLGITVKEIIVDRNIVLPQQIIDTLFTDRFIAPMFYGAVEAIKKEFGNNTIIINGQASDSIFGFGPTEKKFGSLISRIILLSPNTILSTITFNIVRFLRPLNKVYNLPKNIIEYFLAFLDEKSYRPLIDSTKSKEYYNSLLKIIETARKKLSSKYSMLMYLKMHGFLQGSDNYSQVQIPEHFGLKALFLFATPQIVYSTIQNTDYKYEILHPKSVVYKILKDVFNYEMPNLKQEKHFQQKYDNQQKYSAYENEVYKIFYDKLNSLEFAEEVII